MNTDDHDIPVITIREFDELFDSLRNALWLTARAGLLVTAVLLLCGLVPPAFAAMTYLGVFTGGATAMLGALWFALDKLIKTGGGKA
jgi:hypothetical protein